MGCYYGWAVCMPFSINYNIIKRGIDAHPPAHAHQTADFFKERVARQEAHRAMRAAMAAERNRLVVGTSPTSNQQEQQPPQSVVRSWAELRTKHQRERAALARKFREEHDWCVALGERGRERDGGVIFGGSSLII